MRSDRMKGRVLLFGNVGLSVILLICMLGCGEQKSDLKYQEAKRQAEEKLVELEEILKPIKALERGDLSALPTDPESLKRLSEKADIQTIRRLSEEVSKAMQKVFDSMPEGYEDDYDQWTQKVKQRLEAIQ